MDNWTQSCPEAIKQTTSKTEIMGFIFIYFYFYFYDDTQQDP